MTSLPKDGQDRPVLVKIGGSMADDEAAVTALCAALAGLRKSGLALVLVHGGGKDINRNLAWLGEEPVFKDGLRVTGPAALKVVEMTLSGQVNKKLVGLLNANGASAAGLSGVDGPTFLCEPLSAELGQVGRIVKTDTRLVESLLAAGYLPVVSPISLGMGASSSGSESKPVHFNVNADDAASALAVALKASKLVFVSDVEGVRGAAGVRVPELDGAGIENLVAMGVASGGMIPKLRSCKAAAEAGIGEVHICKWEGDKAFSAQLKGLGNTGTIIKR